MELHPAYVCGPLKHFSIQFLGLVLSEDPEASILANDLCLQSSTVKPGLLMRRLFDLAHKAAHRSVLRPHWYGPERRCLKHNSEEHR